MIDIGKNVYYDPEKFGLERVAEIEYSDLSYQFDTRVVWREIASGRLLMARDAGCSCPLPFQGYSREMLESFSLAALESEFASECARAGTLGTFDKEAARRELRKVRQAVGKREGA